MHHPPFPTTLMSLFLADLPEPLQKLSTFNTMIPMATFLVVNFAVQAYITRSYRASLAAMTPEEKVKLMEAQSTGSNASGLLMVMFVVALAGLNAFNLALTKWFVPLFAAIIVLFLILQAYTSRASGKRMEAAGVPAAYTNMRRRQSLVGTTLMFVFMGWLIFNTWSIMGTVHDQMDRVRVNHEQVEKEYQDTLKRHQELTRQIEQRR
jgi:hypothetical protein